MIVGDDMTKKILFSHNELGDLEETATAVDSGPNSAIGKRNAYGALVAQQYKNFEGKCEVTFFSLLTSYTLSIASKVTGKVLEEPPYLKLDPNGVIIRSSENGKFQIGNIVYTSVRKLNVVNLCPFVPLSYNDERSCYSTLLVHSVWPMQGEDGLLCQSKTAVDRLRMIIETNQLPSYVIPSMEKVQKSKDITNNQGLSTGTSHDYSDENAVDG
jgi:hypothetical protein